MHCANCSHLLPTENLPIILLIRHLVTIYVLIKSFSSIKEQDWKSFDIFLLLICSLVVTPLLLSRVSVITLLPCYNSSAPLVLPFYFFIVTQYSTNHRPIRKEIKILNSTTNIFLFFPLLFSLFSWLYNYFLHTYVKLGE